MPDNVWHLMYIERKKHFRRSVKLQMAVWTGLEPATSAVTGRHSNQLNYQTILVAGEGFEPTTFGL